MKKKSEKQKQDHFLKLPDEIIISIFTKLSKTHFKFLCQSVSLVSKRFAFLLHRIPTISVSLPLKCPFPCLFINFVRTLPKFVQINSLNIVAESDCVLYYEPNFLKWRANYNTKSQTFVFLSSASIHSKIEYQGEEVDNEIQMPTTYMKKSLDLSAYNCSVTACLWFALMGMVIDRGHPMLRSVKMTDSNKQGMLCFRDEQLPEMRNGLMGKAKLDTNKILEELKGGYLPVLHLPLSGLVMEGVIIAMFRVGDDDNGDYDDVLNWDFEDGEELFGEAVTTIFRNNMNRFFQFDVPRDGFLS